MKYLLSISNLPILFLLAGMICFPFIGEVNLFDWDETLIASVSKEMYFRNEVLQPYLDNNYFLEKPPFFFWLQLLSYKYLGINEYAARFPNAVCLLLVMLTLYKNGKRIYSSNFGMIWSVIYLSMILVQLYHKSGLVEPWYNFFLYLAIYNLARIMEMRQEWHESYYKKGDIRLGVFYAGLATAGAILTKGLEGFIVILFAYWLSFFISSGKYGMGFVNFFKWLLWVLCIVGIWIGIEVYWHGYDYLNAFYQYQLGEINTDKASWLNKVSVPIIAMLIGCFPASALAFNSLRVQTYESTIQKLMRLMMVSSFIIMLFMVTFVKNKMIHYTSYTFFPISFMAAYSIRYIFEDKVKLAKISWILLIILGMIWIGLLTLIPATRSNISLVNDYIQGETIQSAISMNYAWQEYEIYLGVFFFALFAISMVLMSYKRMRSGLILLFISSMLTSQIVLVYYMPKFEILTQGAQVDFVKQNQDSTAQFVYMSGRSYIAHFYQQSANYISKNYSLDSLPKKSQNPIYLIGKKSDSSLYHLDKDRFYKLYSHGLYTFYKLK